MSVIRRIRSCLVGLSLAYAFAARAQNPNNEQISPVVDLYASGTTVTSTGGLQYFSYGNGNCSGYHRVYASSGGATLLNKDLVQVTSYNGTLSTSSAPYSTCYRATVYAIGVFGTSQQVTSAEWCTSAPPAPPPGACGSGGVCEQSESCPLILDLNGDGIQTTSLEDPVHFWIDLDGQSETTAWTNPSSEEAFLWMDLNHDHLAQVTELFGSRMIAPNGEYHANGYEALEKYDRPEFGGDGDGQITQRDAVWARLKLWVDRNHDAISQPTEISVPSSHGIVALNLAHTDGDTYDEHGNELYIVGSYVVRVHGTETALRLMADIEFRYIAN